MASPKEIGSPSWLLRQPLQIESLRQSIPKSEESEHLLRQLQHLRENLDAVVFALSNRELGLERRQHLVTMLRHHQQALDQCLAALGLPHRRQENQALYYFNQLDPTVRAHLCAILGVAPESAYYEVLDIKAEEYLYQQQAFETLTQHYGFRDKNKFLRATNRAVLVLTLSGSLIQLSEPLPSQQARRYIYQNIYGNAHPPEGILVLDRDLEIGHRLRSVELTTSPVRMLREVGRKMSWKAQTQTFERISRTLTSLGSRSNSQLAAVGWKQVPQTGLLRVTNLSAAERVFHLEYSAAITHYRSLHQRFSLKSEEQMAQIEAELLISCHFLQTAARELGFETSALGQVAELVTEEDHLYRIDPNSPGIITLLPRGKGPEVVLINVTIGRQLVTRQAPLALIDRDGSVVEVTLPIMKIRQR
jgi:hypothetical protein